MKPDLHSHLSDEALDDVLIGLGSATAQEHLSKCSHCRARVEAFQSSVALFNQAAFAYSEARPAKTPLVGDRQRKLPARPVLATWAAAAALLVLAGPAGWRLIVPRPVHAPTNAQTQDSQAQIAEDNELLRQVNAAIAPDEQSVVDQYQLLEGPSQQAHPKMRTE